MYIYKYIVCVWGPHVDININMLTFPIISSLLVATANTVIVVWS